MKVLVFLITFYLVLFLVNSFVNLAKMLLQEEGAKFLLSEKFSQDPLEEHFSRHRRMGWMY